MFLLSKGRTEMSTQRFCEECGARYVGAERFCQECGEPRPGGAPPPKSKVFCSLCGYLVDGAVCSRCGTPTPKLASQPSNMEETMGSDARKVAALLTKAEATSFQAESAAAKSLALELCTKHGVTLEQFEEWWRRQQPT